MNSCLIVFYRTASNMNNKAKVCIDVFTTIKHQINYRESIDFFRIDQNTGKNQLQQIFKIRYLFAREKKKKKSIFFYLCAIPTLEKKCLCENCPTNRKIWLINWFLPHTDVYSNKQKKDDIELNKKNTKIKQCFYMRVCVHVFTSHVFFDIPEMNVQSSLIDCFLNNINNNVKQKKMMVDLIEMETLSMCYSKCVCFVFLCGLPSRSQSGKNKNNNGKKKPNNRNKTNKKKQAQQSPTNMKAGAKRKRSKTDVGRIPKKSTKGPKTHVLSPATKLAAEFDDWSIEMKSDLHTPGSPTGFDVSVDLFCYCCSCLMFNKVIWGKNKNKQKINIDRYQTIRFKRKMAKS